ncbi:MAG: glycogen-branching enzyme, partial [Eubacterium aggregans]
FYSPTSRYGTAAQLMALVDILHQNDIGVILDFVPIHFAVDDYGLAHYDGTALYEYPHEAVGVSEWGSCNFMHSRGEVQSFLQSAADYWLRYYHFDGLRMDAISRILYWQWDEAREVNANGVEFLKTMNSGLKTLFPNCMLIAEDSTNYGQVTTPVNQGGLGFDYKWDMGWMNDTLDYFKKTPKERIDHYHKLTFSMAYFYNEHYLLPFPMTRWSTVRRRLLIRCMGTMP